ncbi:helix-turn-helix transcriptional regulator [Streptomyces sp. NPDC054956]
MPTFVPSRLTAARTLRGLTQPQLGQRIGKSGNAIYTYEVGRVNPPDYVVGLLAQALGLGVADFYEPDPEDPVLRAIHDFDGEPWLTQEMPDLGLSVQRRPPARTPIPA